MNEYKTKEEQYKFYRTSQWSGVMGVRIQALKRDNYECQMCKQEGKVHLDSIKVKGEHKTRELNVHHIKELEHHPELALTLDNLLTVCIRHHNEIHDRYQPKKVEWVREERW